ncbi:MAG TPA: FHA domain-containing protein [Methylomirabilota bacterium]|jgi:pSer/pThr/pTyr-binding forkhead associated (FHA) protein|nr:FHA domain-containing protein [Methylomirabilota bacterium]
MPTLTLVSERTPVKAYELSSLAVNIGRGEDMDIAIDNVSVSRRQARIQMTPSGQWIVEDLSSANGTFVNGKRLTEPRLLSRGDEISFGKFSLFFDRVLKEPVKERAVDVKPDLPRTNETFHMDLKDVERLQHTVAMKRRAHLKWRAAGKQDTFYLERLERSAVLVGRSALCDLRVPAGPKHHLLVLRNRTGYEVRNLSAWYRMRVNGQVVAQAPLKGGDVIEVRGLGLTFFDEIA